MDFKRLFISVIIAGVVVLAIMSFTIQLQNDNNTAQLITNNTIINNSYGKLKGNLSSARGDADLTEQTFGDITPTQSFGIVDVTSIVSPTRIFRSLIVGTFNVLIVLPIKILGLPPVISGVLSAIVFLLLILGIWAIWRGVAT